jgi:hypothetical protein
VSLLSDLLLDLLASGLGLGPSSDRGLVIMNTVGATLCGVAALIAIALSQDFVRGPYWGVGALIGSVVFGAAGAMFSGRHFVRNEDDRNLAAWCLTASLAGPSIPLVWLAIR